MKLVGRDRELEQLRDVCRQARDGRGRVVVVSGDAGLGKSALVEEIANELAPAFTITWGRAWELADAPAYFPLWPCLKSIGVAFDGRGDETGAFELWEHVLEALVRAAATKPVMWIVEDLHVADTQSLDLLNFLAQAVRPLPVMLLATTRAQAADAAHKRIVRLARMGIELRLAPLARENVDVLAKHWLDRDLSADELAQLSERTGGNPLFVIECARAGKGNGKHLLGAVPPTVAVVVGERVEQLPAATRTVLADAAVLGNELTAATLGAMTDKLPARVIDDLAPALRAGLIEELAPGRFRFHHALVRDAIEDQMAPAQRRAAHQRAEAALSSGIDSPRAIVESARHALLGVEAGREAHVTDIVERALSVLEEQGTFDRASQLYRQLRDLRANGVLPGGTPSDLIRGAAIARRAGQFAYSRELSLEAATRARATGDTEQLAYAALAVGAEIHPGVVDPVVVQHLEEALAKAPAGPLHCRLTARLAAAMQPHADPRVPIDMAREAIREARKLGDAALLEDVLYVATSAMIEYVDAEQVRDLNREHLALARTHADAERQIRAYTRLLFNEGELGDFAMFDKLLDEMMLVATAAGHPRVTWRALLMSSMRAIATGQFAESERFISEVERAAQLIDDLGLSMSLSAHRHMRAVDLHRETTVQQAITSIEASIGANLPGRAFIVPMIKGIAMSRFGDVGAAGRAWAALPLDDLFSRGGGTVGWLSVIGEIAACVGTDEQRKNILERIQPFASRHVYFGHTPMIYGGPVRRVIGLLELSLGQKAAGENSLRRALDVCRTNGFAPWVARISFELGEMAEAARLATNLGIRGLAKRAAVPEAESVAPPTKPALGVSREGELWRISYGVRVARVSDARGMELIAKLIERPGEDMHVLVLAGTGGEAMTDSDAGDALDERAAKSYRERIAAIDGEMPVAKGERANQLARERAFLQGELARAFGLGYAPRRVGSMSERARVNVQRRIKDALTRIGHHDPVIADYLRSAIRTGTYCTFRP
ncbi:MAG TPA: AAA family ATPase [Kofleriaceae bacterium]|nr:AAA family ATPase [Kofleriaceae bacterium]